MEELIAELKQGGVLRSSRIEKAFRAIDRKDFVAPEYIGEAYENRPLPIGSGQTISQPYTVAFMLDLLDPQPGETILDVGAGSGWQTSLLAEVVGGANGKRKTGKITAFERIPELCEFARTNIENYDFITEGIVTLACGDAVADLPAKSWFDKIIAAASAESEIPALWRKHLKIGGRIVAPVGNSIWRYTRTSENEWREEEFPGFAFVPLVANGQGGGGGRMAENSPGGGEKSRRLLPVITTLVILIGVISVYATFAPLYMPSSGIMIEIPKGAGSRAIGDILKSQGVIRSKWAFVTYATLRWQASSLKPGEYELNGWISIPGVVSTLVRGERYPNERVVTIPEGWDLRDITSYFERIGAYHKNDWQHFTGAPAADYRRAPPSKKPKDFSKEFSFLSDKPVSVGLEGYLYPDTYRIYRDASIEDVVRIMLANFNAKLTPDIRADIARQRKTIFSVITMASLIEREVSSPSDRRIVSGILWKRLGRGIPLQVDATVNYITGKHGTPSAADLAIDSPFNTYRYPGLPLGPIANPGIDAIRAALYPIASDYLYYLSTPDGKTIFSRTLEEHRTAKIKYL